ncbi:MAG: YceI family protein [Gammaproteobacteria bacterium]
MAPPDLTAPYAAAAAHGISVYRLDPAASRVLILVGKAGPLAGAGHVHVIVVRNLHGFALAASRGGGRADLFFPVRSLAVDPPAALSALGGEYAKAGMSAEDRAGTREHMLGASVLNAPHYPWTALTVFASAAVADKPRAPTVNIRLRGVTRSIHTPGRYRITPESIRAAGAFTLRQTDFGIKPYSVLFGVLRVKDALRIRYHLVFHRWRP